MVKRARRMSSTDIKSIIADLDRWAAGQLGSKLTWAMLEKRFRFSRQSLQAKPEIKAAYDYAKSQLSGGLVKTREVAVKENNELQHENERLKLEIADYKRREILWKQRWQCIAFHIRQRGAQVHQVDASMPNDSKLPTERETNKIVKPFDKGIPPTGRV